MFVYYNTSPFIEILFDTGKRDPFVADTNKNLKMQQVRKSVPSEQIPHSLGTFVNVPVARRRSRMFRFLLLSADLAFLLGRFSHKLHDPETLDRPPEARTSQDSAESEDAIAWAKNHRSHLEK
jgi:hypothetical protein